MALKLALGTAQFGLPYGITNQSGQVNRTDAKGILELARFSSIDTVDTAIAYGDSESCLGQLGMDGLKVITKLPPVSSDIADVASWVQDQIQASLQRLNMVSVYAVLLHRPQDLFGPLGLDLYYGLLRLKDDGLVKKIGISIYAPTDLDIVLGAYQIDLVQAPFNLMDQRLKSSGWLLKLHNLGIEIHTRSAFLQGLLLTASDSIPEKFKYWQPLFNNWDSWLIDNNVSAIQACVGFVKAHPEISKVVVGVESINQLRQLIKVAKEPISSKWPNISCSDEHLINPSNWNIL